MLLGLAAANDGGFCRAAQFRLRQLHAAVADYDSDEVHPENPQHRACSADSEPAMKWDEPADRDSGPRLDPIREPAPRADADVPRGRQPAPRSYREGGSRTEPAYRERVEECRNCRRRKSTTARRSSRRSARSTSSRVINTVTVVPVGPRVRETNHLIIHENETRHDRRDPAQQHHRRERNPLRAAGPGDTTVALQSRHYRRWCRPVVYVPIIQRQSGCGCYPPPPPVQSCGNCGGGVPVVYAGYGAAVSRLRLSDEHHAGGRND